MFMASAATDTKQGKAIHAINERWGTTNSNQCRSGTENIGIQVCKKKYSPFEFRLRKISSSSAADGSKASNRKDKWTVDVRRLYGCALHTKIRKESIKEHGGERTGWESFGQWSLNKAKQLAKRFLEEQMSERPRKKRPVGRPKKAKTKKIVVAKPKQKSSSTTTSTPTPKPPSSLSSASVKIQSTPKQEPKVEEPILHRHNTRNRGKRKPCILFRKQVDDDDDCDKVIKKTVAPKKEQDTAQDERNDDMEDMEVDMEEVLEEIDESSEDEEMIGPFLLFDEDKSSQSLKQLCHNGSCTWKVKHKYDDIVAELMGDSSDSE